MCKDRTTESLLNIEKEEVKCEELVSRKFREELEINLETFDILQFLFGGASGRVKDIKLERYQKAHILLYARILEDLRAIQILIKKGHTPEAAIVCSALFEGSLQMQFIHSNNKRAKKWFNHKDEKRSVWPVTQLIRNLSLGAETEQLWSFLCRIKHYKSELIAVFHLKEETISTLLIHPGPHLGEEDDLNKKFILIYSAILAIEGVNKIYEQFVKYHLSPTEWVDRFRILRKKVSSYLDLLKGKLNR